MDFYANVLDESSLTFYAGQTRFVDAYAYNSPGGKVNKRFRVLPNYFRVRPSCVRQTINCSKRFTRRVDVIFILRLNIALFYSIY